MNIAFTICSVLALGSFIFFLFRQFYSYWTVASLAALMFLTVQIYSAYFEKYMLFSVSAIIILIGVLITASNVSLVRHEGFGFKRILGIPIIAFGALSMFFINVKILRELICFFQLMLISYFIVSYIAVKKKVSFDKDFVIILGCLISKNGSLLPLLKSRTNKAIRFAWDQEIATGKVVRYVPTGGQGANEVISEGSAIEMYLLTHGAENYEVFTEKKSKNTYENMKFSKAVIDENTDSDADVKVAFATTNYHVFRSGILARKVGLDAEGISSSTKWYFWPAALVREFIGFMDMHIPQNLIFIAGILISYWLIYE